MLYVNLGTLSQRAGVPSRILPRLVIKELVDNALDAADKAGRPGAVTLSIEDGNLVVEDRGDGIEKAGPAGIAEMFSGGAMVGVTEEGRRIAWVLWPGAGRAGQTARFAFRPAPRHLGRMPRRRDPQPLATAPRDRVIDVLTRDGLWVRA